MMDYRFENSRGSFVIHYDESAAFKYTVHGSIDAARLSFRRIRRRPPDEYGTFYGYSRAGYQACRELIEAGGWEEVR